MIKDRHSRQYIDCQYSFYWILTNSMNLKSKHANIFGFILTILTINNAAANSIEFRAELNPIRIAAQFSEPDYNTASATLAVGVSRSNYELAAPMLEDPRRTGAEKSSKKKNS